MKWRNSKERELLSTGGTRDETLPNKNNPCPDLSDTADEIEELNSDDEEMTDIDHDELMGSSTSSGITFMTSQNNYHSDDASDSENIDV